MDSLIKIRLNLPTISIAFSKCTGCKLRRPADSTTSEIKTINDFRKFRKLIENVSINCLIVVLFTFWMISFHFYKYATITGWIQWKNKLDVKTSALKLILIVFGRLIDDDLANNSLSGRNRGVVRIVLSFLTSVERCPWFYFYTSGDGTERRQQHL